MQGRIEPFGVVPTSMALPTANDVDRLLTEIEGIIGLSASFPQSRYELPDRAEEDRYAQLGLSIHERLRCLRESGLPFVNPNPHHTLAAMWRWCWTLPGGASGRISRPRELYADLIMELRELKAAVSQGADAPGEVLRELRESALRTNELFVIVAFRDETLPFWSDVVLPSARVCGLRAVRVDRAEPEGAISEEILSSIRRALLVLCDLSFERPNCYFEAGFAKGSFRRVVFTARKDHDPRADHTGPYKIHFDVDQFKITWWEPDHLQSAQREVEDRIRSVLALVRGSGTQGRQI